MSLLTGMVERHASLDPAVNGFTIWALIDLKAVESMETIRAAFDAGTVNISIAGDKEDAEIALGLREKRTIPKPDYPLSPMRRAAASTRTARHGKRRRPHARSPKLGIMTLAHAAAAKNTRSAAWKPDRRAGRG